VGNMRAAGIRQKRRVNDSGQIMSLFPDFG
jgi:hypothetical protein